MISQMRLLRRNRELEVWAEFKRSKPSFCELEMFGVLVGLKLLVEKTAAFAESYDQAGARLVQGLHAKSIMTLQGMLTSQDRPKKELLGSSLTRLIFLEYVHGILCEISLKSWMS